MRAVYIHIPFCKSICSYCDFCKMFYHTGWVNKYLKVLRNEMKDQYLGEKISSIYIGGGTPSCLSEEEMIYLLESISIFQKAKDCEITIECNINDITKEKLAILKTYRVNRLSIGIQSFQEKKLILMGRNHTYENVQEKIKMIRKMGFKNINIDLIYGFYNENKKDIKNDIKKVLKLKPEHISTYSLILSAHTLLHINKIPSISDDLDAEFYWYLCGKLKHHNYQHYEVSNFAKKGYESKHNLSYWNNEEYYGFGLSASGYLEGVRYMNTFNLTKYLNQQNDGKKELLTQKDMMDNEIMLGLRKRKGIHITDFEKKFEIKIEDAYPITPLIKTKDLIKKDGYIFINPDKIYVMNEILMKLL